MIATKLNNIVPFPIRTQVKRPVFNTRIASLGDAHGSLKWIELSKRAERNSDKIIGLGDLIDRGIHNIDVLKRAQELNSSGRYTQILGNHDLLFVNAALGDELSLVNWIRNGGEKTLDEFRVNPLQKILSKMFGYTPKQSVMFMDFAYWIMENAKLYHIDEHGALYTHAGIPINDEGVSTLEYSGIKGIKCLDKATDDLRNALLQRNFGHEVFKFLQGNENAFLWDTNWFEKLIKIDSANNLIDSLGINHLIFGHLPKRGVISIDNKVFCIGGNIESESASFIINGPKTIEIESLSGQRTVIEK